MENRYICKRAISKYDGKSAERMNALVVKKRYPIGSTYVYNNYLKDIGDCIREAYESLDEQAKSSLNQFPRLDKRLIFNKKNV